jgi:hypothetical protein
MGHCGDIQAKDPIDCGEPFVCGSNCWCCSADIRGRGLAMRIVAFGYWRVDGLVVGVVRSAGKTRK